MQVITTLKQTTFPITEVAFPAITICGSGFHMDNVKTALQHNFAKWREEMGRKDVNLVAKDFAEYMEAKFQITSNRSDGERPNILDMLDTMIASDAEASVAANGVRQNALACSEGKASLNRKKRTTAAELADSVDGYNCEEYGYSSNSVDGEFPGRRGNSEVVGQVDHWTDCLQRCRESDTCQYWQWKTAESPNKPKRCILIFEMVNTKSDNVDYWGIPKVKHIRGPRSCKKEASLLSGNHIIRKEKAFTCVLDVESYSCQEVGVKYEAPDGVTPEYPNRNWGRSIKPVNDWRTCLRECQASMDSLSEDMICTKYHM